MLNLHLLTDAVHHPPGMLNFQFALIPAKAGSYEVDRLIDSGFCPQLPGKNGVDPRIPVLKVRHAGLDPTAVPSSVTPATEPGSIYQFQ